MTDDVFARIEEGLPIGPTRMYVRQVGAVPRVPRAYEVEVDGRVAAGWWYALDDHTNETLFALQPEGADNAVVWVRMPPGGHRGGWKTPVAVATRTGFAGWLAAEGSPLRATIVCFDAANRRLAELPIRKGAASVKDGSAELGSFANSTGKNRTPADQRYLLCHREMPWGLGTLLVAATVTWSAWLGHPTSAPGTRVPSPLEQIVDGLAQM